MHTYMYAYLITHAIALTPAGAPWRRASTLFCK